MKNVTLSAFIAVILMSSLAACTFGDKGSDKVPDSVRIDTAMSSQSGTGQDSTKKPVIDSLQTDTAGKLSKP